LNEKATVSDRPTNLAEDELSAADPDDKCCRSTPRCDGCPYTGGNPNRPPR